MSHKNNKYEFNKSHKSSLGDTGSSYIFLSNVSTIALTFIAIYVFNLGHIFADVLWHDDGFWYFAANTQQPIHQWRDNISEISTFTPYLNHFYAYGMVDWGLPATRSIFVLIMFSSSVSLYFIYKTIFGISSKVAVTAALIPNILPSLIGIPMGLNTSYAMWGLLPILISLQLTYHAIIRSGPPSYFFWLLGVSAYAIGLNLAISATFLIPSVLFFIAIFVLAGQNKSKPIVYVTPFLILSIWHIYKHILFSHKIPTQVPLDEVFDRSIQFLEMGSFLPFNSPVSIYITLFLILIGLTGLVAGSSQFIVKPAHFGFSEAKYRMMLVAWPLVWTVSNSVAYVAASPTFRVDDYPYVCNFGIVLLQVFGIAYSWDVISNRIGWPEKTFRITLILVFAGVIVFTGIQKLEQLDSTLKQNGFVETSSILRRHLQSLAIPPHSQIVVLDAPAPHPGGWLANTGYMQYLLGRNDVSAVIGPNIFPNDLFVKTTDLLSPMHNFKPHKPIIIFKKVGNDLTSKKLFLQVKSSGQKDLPREQWALFDVSQPGYVPIKIAGNLGMPSYHAYIENQLPPPYTSSDIAFAPGNNPSTFLSRQQASEIAKSGGLLDSEVNFNDVVSLRAAKEVQVDSGQALELLIHVENIPGDVKLGYRINSEPIQRLDIWEMAMYGDNILTKIAIPNNQKTSVGITFQFFDMEYSPYSPIPLKDKNNASKIELVLR